MILSTRSPEAMLGTQVAPPDDQIPRYRWIREQLVKMLIDGGFKGGDELPAEGQLAKHFGVALGTLRKAIDDLVSTNVLNRVQGKGLFVSAYDTQAAIRLFNVVNKDGSKELPQFGQILGIKARAPSTIERARLELDKDQRVVEVKRLRSFSDGAAMRETIALPESLFPEFKRRLGERRPVLLYDFYEQAYHIRIASVVSRIRAVAATGEDVETIGVARGAPLLEIERVALELGSRPVELRVTRCNTEDGRHYLDVAN